MGYRAVTIFNNGKLDIQVDFGEYRTEEECSDAGNYYHSLILNCEDDSLFAKRDIEMKGVSSQQVKYFVCTKELGKPLDVSIPEELEKAIDALINKDGQYMVTGEDLKEISFEEFKLLVSKNVVTFSSIAYRVEKVA